MKNKYILSVITGLIMISSGYFAQAQFNYTLSVSSSSYEPLTNPTTVTSANTTFTLSLPFPFTYSMLTHNTATVSYSNDAYINFGTQGIVSLVTQMNVLNASTQTGFQVTGTSPNRILKFEWQNHGFSKTSTPDDSLSLQLWLYETSNIIEWHFGPSAYTAASLGAGPMIIMIFDQYTTYAFIGAVNSPSIIPCLTTCHLAGLPPSGTVYPFNASDGVCSRY